MFSSRKVQPSRTGPFKHLDVAGGTGDIAFRVARAGGPKTKVTVLDINGDMLAVGRERAEKKGLAKQLTFVEANAEDLPFPDGEFDAYTIAFGIRNVPRIDRALAEAYRVLKRGGHFLCLEFSQVEAPAAGQGLRILFLLDDPADRAARHRRGRALSLSGRIDPPVSGRGGIRGDDRDGPASSASASRG